MRRPVVSVERRGASDAPRTDHGWEQLLREASASRLGKRAHLTPRDVRRRRAQLSAIGLVLLLTLGAVTAWLLAAPAAGHPWWPSARTLHLATVALAVGFAAYIIEKEIRLRRLSQLLEEQRTLTSALTHRVGDLEPLGRLEARAAAAAGPGEVLMVVLTEALRQGRWASGAILVPDGREHLRVICSSGAGYEVESEVRIGDGPAGRAASRGEPVLSPGDGAGPSLAVPMLVDDRTVGVLSLTAPTGRTFSEDDRLVLGLFAECAAPWIESAVTTARRAVEATLAHQLG